METNKENSSLKDGEKYGNCALCKEFEILKLSHRIPRAVGALIKKNSFSKRFRSTHDPNTPIQDLDKEYLLCGKCEQIFGNKENLFTQRVLRPYRESRNMTFEYDEWLYYFITSLSWKTLYNDSLDRDEFIGNGFTNGQFDSLVKAELQMRKYLTEESRACLNIDNHLIFLDNSLDVKDSSKIEYSTYCNATLGYVFGNQNTGALYVFHILAGVLVITVIKKHSTDKYKNTYVKKGKGKIKESQSIKSLVMESEVLDHIPRQLENARQNMSEHQQQKLIAKIEKDPEGFLRSSSSINYREG